MYDQRNEIANSMMQQQPGASGMPGQPPPQMSATAGIPQQAAMPQPTLGGLGNMMSGTPTAAPAGGPVQFPNQSIMQGFKAGAGGNTTPIAGAGNFNMPGAQPQGLGAPQPQPFPQPQPPLGPY